MKANKKCSNCNEEVSELVPMGLIGTKFDVCKKCKEELREKFGIADMSFGMKYYFETGIDKYPESNSDNW